MSGLKGGGRRARGRGLRDQRGGIEQVLRAEHRQLRIGERDAAPHPPFTRYVLATAPAR